jgi:uncharacterized protein
MRSSSLRIVNALILVLGTTGICWAQAPARGQAPAIPPGYAGRTQINTHGLAPGMKSAEVAAARHFNLNFARGDDPMAGLAEFAEVNHLTDCRFTAIGAFGSAVLGWFDPAVGAYKKIEVPDEAEVVSMSGSIRMQNGKPFVHAHTVVGMSDGSTRAGHIIEAKVSLSLEVYLTSGEPKSDK